MPTHPRVLVVDADGADCTAVRHLLAAAGHETIHAAGCDAALDELERAAVDVVLLAYDVVGLHGITVLAAAPGAASGAQIVIRARAADLAAARDGLRLGAFDLLERDADSDALLFAVERAAREGSLRRELAQLRARVGEVAERTLVGRSGAVMRVRELVGRAAGSRMTVLVTGEAGTGKDTVARLVHDLSDRAGQPFVSVRCAGADADALEAELFGTSRGGTLARPGLFEEARGGTLVLDEVTDVPAAVRERLAQALAERAVRRVGVGTPVPIDVRLVLTAREELEHAPLFASGDDLFGRLNVLPIFLPPLRERRSDIPLLVQHFRARLAREMNVDLAPVSGEIMMSLLGHEWPGNVRELLHWVERSACAPGLARSAVPDGGAPPERNGVGFPQDASWTVEELERRYILHVLSLEDGHQSRAADRLGIDRRTLYRKLKQYRDAGSRVRAAS